jgi:signal transduction histidine kinase
MEAMIDQVLVEHLFSTASALPVLAIHDGRISRCSESAHDLLQAWPNQPLEALFDERSRSKVVAALGPQPSSCEVHAYSSDNELVAIRLSLVPRPNGEHLAFVTEVGLRYGEQFSGRLLEANDHLANLTRDLARKSAELDAACRRFETLAEEREHFISMLAHDVRASLNSVVLSAQLIALEVADSGTTIQSDAAERIRLASGHAVELVEKVLEIARTEPGHTQLDLRPVSLRTIARELVEIYEPIADRGGVGLRVIELGGNEVVAGDRVRLSQVLGNVIDNALRHSLPGGTVTIELGGRLGVARSSCAIPGRAFCRTYASVSSSGSCKERRPAARLVWASISPGKWSSCITAGSSSLTMVAAVPRS